MHFSLVETVQYKTIDFGVLSISIFILYTEKTTAIYRLIMRKTRKEIDAEWEVYKSEIETLFLKEKKTRDEVMEVMEKIHGFQRRFVIQVLLPQSVSFFLLTIPMVSTYCLVIAKHSTYESFGNGISKRTLQTKHGNLSPDA